MSSVAKLIATIETEMDAESEHDGEKPDANPEHLRMVEALLFAAGEPLDQKALSTSLPEGADVPGLLAALQEIYEKRGVNLCCVAGKYQFRTASDLAFLLRKEQPEQKRLSQGGDRDPGHHRLSPARHPGRDRGHSRCRHVQGHDRHPDGVGWVKIRGRKRTPGRPVTYGTTEAFLVQFGLESVAHLPGAGRTQGCRLPGSDAAFGLRRAQPVGRTDARTKTLIRAKSRRIWQPAASTWTKRRRGSFGPLSASRHRSWANLPTSLDAPAQMTKIPRA